MRQAIRAIRSVGSPSTMSRSSSSVRPTRGPRSSAPSASVSRAIGEDAGQRDEILDFLPAEKALAGLGRHGDAARSSASS